MHGKDVILLFFPFDKLEDFCNKEGDINMSKITSFTSVLIRTSHLFRYGNKAPRSFGARVFAVVWIFFGLVIMAIFMANITTALTAASLEYDADLFNKRYFSMFTSYNLSFF